MCNIYTTVKPQYNEPLRNKVLVVKNGFTPAIGKCMEKNLNIMKPL